MNIYDLKTEHLTNPVGIDAAAPRFSWKIFSKKQNVKQTGYQIKAYAGGQLIWDSGIVASEQSQNILYSGETLRSREQVAWTVTVTAGNENATSGPAYFEMGILDPDEWKGIWIEPEEVIEDKDQIRPVPYMRKEFIVKPGLKKARIYQSAHGLYEFWVNGVVGTEEKMKPGFTSYYHRVQYQVYDIAALLKEGVNVWGVALGDGWWRGIVAGAFRNDFGYQLGYIGQIMLEYEDGSCDVIGTDESFKTAAGGILMSDMKMGDIYDARLEPDGWKYSGFDDSGWRNVFKATDSHCTMDVLIPSRSVPVREKEQFIPRILKDINGDLVLDFGQNIAGYVKMTLRNVEPGQKVVLSHGEDIKNGAYSQGNIKCNGMAGEEHLQQVDYICKGLKEETYKPMFSIFGFRYVKVDGYDADEICPGDFVAMAVYSDCTETGDFTCSNELINQLVRNSRWSQKGNFNDVPTDCPTRERSPWSGDSQVYARTATMFMDVYSFFEKWMIDQKLEQMPSGKVANTFPSTLTMQNTEEMKRITESTKGSEADAANIVGDMVNGNPMDGSAGWGDCAVINPYIMYLCYGDKKILENQYESAKRWVDYIDTRAKLMPEFRKNEPQYQNYTDGELDGNYMWDIDFAFGEWLETDRVAVDTDMAVLADRFIHPDNEVPTAYYCYSAKLVSEMAEILGKDEDARTYAQLSEKVRKVFNKYLIKEDGSIKEGRQAPNVRALEFGIPDSDRKQKVADKLAEYVKTNNFHLNTGFLSTPYILQQLCDNGYKDYAFLLLEQESSPSWLYNVKAGATSILETWTGMDDHNLSFNHYSYGAVCNFMFSTIAGIRPEIENPGYKHFTLCPTQGGTLTHAEATYECIYGTIRSAWRKTGRGTRYEFTIPVNTTATLILPGQEPCELGSGDYVINV